MKEQYLLLLEIYDKARVNEGAVYPITIDERYYIIENVSGYAEAKRKVDNFIKSKEKSLPSHRRLRIKELLNLHEINKI